MRFCFAVVSKVTDTEARQIAARFMAVSYPVF
jgi:hypothetical protein